jgi:hypothetical protein
MSPSSFVERGPFPDGIEQVFEHGQAFEILFLQRRDAGPLKHCCGMKRLG